MPAPFLPYPNDCLPLFDAGDKVTCLAGAVIIGSRFVKISGSSPDGTPQVIQSVAGDHSFGVAARNADPTGSTALNTPGSFVFPDGTSGYNDHVMVYHASSIIVPVTAAAALTADQLVMSDANGQAVPFAAGGTNVALGRVLFDTPVGMGAFIDRQSRS